MGGGRRQGEWAGEWGGGALALLRFEACLIRATCVCDKRRKPESPSKMTDISEFFARQGRHGFASH